MENNMGIMRTAETGMTAIIVIISSGLAYVAGEVSAERISVIASLLYLISQHELNRVTEKTVFGYAKNITFVIMIGFSGGWFVSNVLAVDYMPDMSASTTKVLQMTFGFLSYELLLLFGGNAKSVVKQVVEIAISKVKKGKLWNSFSTSK